MALTITAAGSANSTTASASLTVTGITAAVGDWLVVVCAADNAGTSGASSMGSASDSASNTWTTRAITNRTQVSSAADGATLGFFTAQVTSALSSGTVSISFSPNTTSKAAVVWRVQPGTGEAVAYGTVGPGATGSTSAPTITTSSITNGTTVFGAWAGETNAAVTADSDTTNGSWATQQTAVASTGSAASSQTVATQYKTVTGTGTQTYNLTTTVVDYAINWLTLYRVTDATGGVTAGAAALAGTGTQTFDGVGAVTAGAAALSGTGGEEIASAGAVTAAAAVLSGTGTAVLIPKRLPITTTIELELAGRGNGWTNISGDVLTPVRLGYGIRGAGPMDRTASSGTMTFTLNNSAQNAARTLGYYSPGHVSARTGWSLGIRVRARFYDPASATTYTKFVGTVTSITPAPGLYGPRTVQVVATDWIDEAARATVAGLTTQINKRSDEVLALLVGNVSRAPEAQAIATGKDTYAYALDTARDDRPNPVLQEIARVVASELGYFYVEGDGTAVFEARFSRLSTTDAVTLDNSMAGLTLTTSRDSILTRVQAVTHPRTVDTSTVVLYNLKSSTQVPVGQTLTLLGGYTDPNNRASRVGGTAMVAPVATTDYTANSAADGTGTDLTSALTVVASFGSNGVRFDITNTGGQVAYLTKLQARGKGIYDYENTVGEADDASLAATFGDHVASIDMPYQSDVRVGLDAARYLLALYTAGEVGVWKLGTAGASGLGQTTQLAVRVQTTVGSVSVAPTSSTLQTQMLAREVGDRIGLVETVTGLAKSFYIQAIDLEVQAPGTPFVTWTLAPADTTVYWRLGRTGFGELGAATRLAYT